MFQSAAITDTPVARASQHAEEHFFSIQPLGPASSRQRRLTSNEEVYRIVFVTKGGYDYWQGKRMVRLAENSIGLIRPGDTFELPCPVDATGYVLSFSRYFLRSVVSSAAILETVHFNRTDIMSIAVAPGEASFLQEAANRLLTEFNDKGMKEEVVISLFHLFVLFLKRSLTSQAGALPGRCQYHAKRFFVLLDKHFHRYKMPADYAELMSVTPAYLNNVIKDSLGFTTSYFIHQRILAEAKRLMTYDELSMKEVAYRLGFEDVSHFSKFFKRIAGKRFTDYKRSLLA